jgi:hypothetical protein
MKLTFWGNFKKLDKCMLRTDVTGQWREIENNQTQYCTDDGAFLNWWESSGTITFQGQKLAKEKLEKLFVRVARKKGLLKGKRDTDEEIARLRGGQSVCESKSLS